MSYILLPILVTIFCIFLIYKLISFIAAKRKSKMSFSTKLLITMLISVFIVLAGVFVIANISGPTKVKAPSISSNTIDYSIIDNKSIGNIGETIIIQINPLDKNEEKLIKLGKQLSVEYNNIQMVYIYIFDSKEAALLFNKVTKDEELTEIENEIYNNHFVGRYFKNSNTKKNEFLYYLNGLNEDGKTIVY